jgi:membrane protease YdiL (CAAX protease family)
MNYSPQSLYLPQKPWLERLQALFEVLLVSGLFSSFLTNWIFSAFHRNDVELMSTNATVVSIFLLVESAITFLVLRIITRTHRETFRNFGLRLIRWKPDFLIGMGLAILLLVVNFGVAFFFQHFLPKYSLEKNPLTEIIHTPQQLAIFIFAALIAGGIKEELQRAFILNRFSAYLGGPGLGLILWSLAFGAGHYIQGVQGITIATIYGFLFGIIYLLRGSLIAPIVAHSAYDTLALLAYWFARHS